MNHARDLTVCLCLKCAQIAWKTSQQSQGHNLEEVGQEISQNTVFTNNFWTHMYHVYKCLHIILI